MKHPAFTRRDTLKTLAALSAAATSPLAFAQKPITVGVIYVGPRDDYGYNQAHAEAAAQLKKMAGVKVVEEENVPETAAVQRSMTGMIAQDGASLVFPTSFGYFDPHMLAVAGKNDKVRFAHCGGLCGCGGLVGVNAGSTEPPRMVKLVYTPTSAKGKVVLVGKGVMYDSGGISLKPSNESHAAMKMDMSGAAAVLAAMSTLKSLRCKTQVTGYLCCTDNLPSGSAFKRWRICSCWVIRKAAFKPATFQAFELEVMVTPVLWAASPRAR